MISQYWVSMARAWVCRFSIGLMSFVLIGAQARGAGLYDDAVEKRNKADQEYTRQLLKIPKATPEEIAALKARIIQPAEREFQAAKQEALHKAAQNAAKEIREGSGKKLWTKLKQTDAAGGKPGGDKTEEDDASPTPPKASSSKKPIVGTGSSRSGDSKSAPKPADALDGSKLDDVIDF
ncbi:MAG: hypothetical protein IT285_02950 [Bdellovibrionales bacterium]|nr:hypothetical protein [Bdellovibrionales bacterium]